MTKHDPAVVQLCLPLSEDRGSSAFKQIAESRKRRNRKSSPTSAAEPLCRHCGVPVPVPQWLLPQGLDSYYCNAACRRAWATEDITREDVVVDLKLSTSRSRGANWRVQSRAARERDRYTCRVCGLTEDELGKRLHVHHTIPYSRFKSNIEANRLDYLISVCPTCHGQLEAKLRRELPLFADITGARRQVPGDN